MLDEGFIYIAHRGLHDDEYPENSMGSFLNAIDKGFAFETDVWLTTDGKLVAFHDDDMTRMCGVGGCPCELSSAEVTSRTLAGTNEHVPLFSDVLKKTAGRVPILIEIKRAKNIRKVAPALFDMLKDYDGPVMIQSFSPIPILWFKKNAPQYMRGMLYAKDHAQFASLFNKRTEPDFVAIDSRFTPEEASKIIGSRKSLTWTIRSEEELSKFTERNGAIFENFYPRGKDHEKDSVLG